ncbi:MAG: hypothetical protein JMJ93_05790 [Synergistaceae bacterium]|jgi:chromosome segregation ATPase|nr:hypothetical protein [Synergistaceae bacterium]
MPRPLDGLEEIEAEFDRLEEDLFSVCAVLDELNELGQTRQEIVALHDRLRLGLEELNQARERLEQTIDRPLQGIMLAQENVETELADLKKRQQVFSSNIDERQEQMARELEARFRQCLLLDDRLKDLNGQKDRIRGDLEAHVAACQRAQTSLAGRLDAVERLIEEQGGKLQSLHQAEEALSDRLTLIRNIAAASLLLGGAGLLLALIGP